LHPCYIISNWVKANIFAFIPKTIDEVYGFNVAAFDPSQKAKFVEQLRTNPELRKSQAQAGAAIREAAPDGKITPDTSTITPEKSQSLTGKGFLSPVGATPAGEQRVSASLPSILRGPVSKISKGIKKDVSTVKQSVDKFKTVAKREIEKSRPTTFTKLFPQFALPVRAAKTTFSSLSSFKLPKFEFRSPFSLPKKTTSKVKSTASSLFGKAKSFISGLFGR